MIAAMAALALASCKKEALVNHSEPAGSERVELTVNVGGEQTKATTADTPEEAKINSIQILVFREDGSIDAYKQATSSPVSGVSCTAGSRTIYAVANCPEGLSSVKSLSELNARKFAFTNENLNGFQMIGNTTKRITAADGNASVTVDRAVAKIHFTNIKTDFQAPAYQGMAFKVTKIYAINVVGNYQVTYPTTVAAPTVNKARLDASLAAGPKSLLLYQPATPTAVTNGATATSVDKSFYVYPNYSTAEADKTRIVVEATLGGKTYYYPLTFSNTIKANTYYDITSLVIKRPGSDNPNTPVIVKDCDFTVVVSDWTTGETISPSI